MGTVHAEITLKNVEDSFKARDGLIKDQEIRQTTVTAIVDTGAATLVINEDQRLQLGLGIRGECHARLANNFRETVRIADPVRVCWKNRDMVCEPWVVAGSPKVLLGAIPLENMDLIVDPTKQELTGAHGDEIVGLLV